MKTKTPMQCESTAGLFIVKHPPEEKAEQGEA